MTEETSKIGPALLIDLDGVLYEADTLIPGAAEAIAWLRDRGVPHLFLTNTTSKSRPALVEKLSAMGIGARPSDIVMPPFAANLWLAEHVGRPVALFVAEGAVAEFTDVEITSPDSDASVGAVVIGDYSDRWTFDELNRAFRLLMSQPRPKLIALGMTRYWHAGDGLRLDVAPFVVALQHATGLEPIVLGKPARPFFDMALTALGSRTTETWMIGDDVRSDIGGAQQAGLRGILVRTGKFRPGDLDHEIVPDAVLGSIADLPEWWEAEQTRARSE